MITLKNNYHDYDCSVNIVLLSLVISGNGPGC